jgi:hypothetical protein
VSLYSKLEWDWGGRSLWRLRCVLGELFNRTPILPGDSDPGQLELIVQRCGPLNDETMPGWKELAGLQGQEGRRWDNIPKDKSITAWAASFT